jgi:hypothetical protein
VSADLWCLMRAAELERRLRSSFGLPERELEQLDQWSQDEADPDSLEEENQPYFWNRRD